MEDTLFSYPYPATIEMRRFYNLPKVSCILTISPWASVSGMTTGKHLNTVGSGIHGATESKAQPTRTVNSSVLLSILNDYPRFLGRELKARNFGFISVLLERNITLTFILSTYFEVPDNLSAILLSMHI